MPRYLTRTRGFSLLEVLIALLVFSFGLLGAAGLMVLSVRTNHSAYLRTQASFLAQSMADRIRGNTGWTEDYNGDYSKDTAGSSACGGNGVCTNREDLVARDKEIWSQQLVDFLPAATANINCEGTQLGAGAQVGAAPFDGICTMTIEWSEASIKPGGDAAQDDGTPDRQTFAWVFQP